MLCLGLGLVACYSPRLQPGAPCDPQAPSPCPAPELCVPHGGAYACEQAAPLPADARPGDAAVADARPGDALPADAAPGADASNADTDGDGIPDAHDNCPTVPNPDQANEDGDRFGDVCDPCPIIADDAPADTDGDGVADACDPRPNTAGDHIVLFEGFDSGIPAGWTKVGAWAAGSGSVTASEASADSQATLTVALAVSGGETVAAGITPLAHNATDDASAGVTTDAVPGTKQGLYCHLTYWRSAATPLVAVQLKSSNPSTAAFDWMTGATYALAETRTATGMQCTGKRAGTVVTVVANTTLSTPNPQLGLRVSDADARFTWLMVIDH